MNKQDAVKFFKGIKRSLSKHSPEIFVGVGVAGMITTTVLAVKGTPTALELIEKKKKEEDKDKLTAVETVKVAWKPYVPAMLLGTASVACIIGGSRVGAKRYTALMSAYQLSTSALTEYRDKVIETIGEEKEKEVQEKVAQAKVDKNPPSRNEVIMTGRGETLCFDATSGRYFKCDKIKIEKAQNTLNYRMNAGMEMNISLNEFYDEIGVPRLYPLGEEIGWRVDQGMIDVHFGATLTENDEPCIVIEHLMPPDYNYRETF